MFLPPEGLESAISASDRLQTHVLDPADTGIGLIEDYLNKYWEKQKKHSLSNE
jgi:hypothetical protein